MKINFVKLIVVLIFIFILFGDFFVLKKKLKKIFKKFNEVINLIRKKNKQEK